MLSTATSSNVGFWTVVQLFAPPTNLATHVALKIPFINSEKIIVGLNNMRTNWGLVGLRLGLRLVLGFRLGLGLWLALGSV